MSRASQPPRMMQARRIRAQFGVSPSHTALIAQLHYGGAR
jgi:hypothetical protein